jgi:hypothetical protein
VSAPPRIALADEFVNLHLWFVACAPRWHVRMFISARLFLRNIVQHQANAEKKLSKP